jgi:hypothetical protein
LDYKCKGKTDHRSENQELEVALDTTPGLLNHGEAATRLPAESSATECFLCEGRSGARGAGN